MLQHFQSKMQKRIINWYTSSVSITTYPNNRYYDWCVFKAVNRREIYLQTHFCFFFFQFTRHESQLVIWPKRTAAFLKLSFLFIFNLICEISFLSVLHFLNSWCLGHAVMPFTISQPFSLPHWAFHVLSVCKLKWKLLFKKKDFLFFP